MTEERKYGGNYFYNLPVYILGEAVGLSSTFFLREKNLPNGDLERERFPSGVPSFGKVLPDLEIKLVYYQTQSPQAIKYCKQQSRR